MKLTVIKTPDLYPMFKRFAFIFCEPINELRR